MFYHSKILYCRDQRAPEVPGLAQRQWPTCCGNSEGSDPLHGTTAVSTPSDSIGSSNCNTSTLMNNLFDNFTMGTNYEYFCMKSTRLNISAGKIEIFTNFCNVSILDPSDINVLHWAYTSSSNNSSIIV